ncbi:MAG: HAD-IIB family hydrolase [Planctomycetota bacterium]
MSRLYDAIVLDLDGTLLDESGSVSARNREALLAAAAEGVVVMIATGRSSLSAQPILEDLGLDTPAVVFNGAALYAPRERKMLEERVLSNRTLARSLELGLSRDWMTVLMCADRKLALEPRDEIEASALSLMTGLQYVSRAQLAAEFVVRVTYFSREHATSGHFGDEVEREIAHPIYLTHFPLSVLPSHRQSPLHVVDVHPPCRGKGEALRILEENYGIPAARVVAVGDATNDIPMFEAAGLSVAMASGMEEARAAAKRVIGGHDTAAIAELVEEIFLAPARRPSPPQPSSSSAASRRP